MQRWVWFPTLSDVCLYGLLHTLMAMFMSSYLLINVQAAKDSKNLLQRFGQAEDYDQDFDFNDGNADYSPTVSCWL